MRLKYLTVAGLRGFNEERTFVFGERLTLVGAPNSYGKTSITEALEFLLFGQTSKVAHAESKEEYHESYRNGHWPSDKPAYVEVSFSGDSGQFVKMRIELDASGEIRRFVEDSPVQEWPFTIQAARAASPFILQHALKSLLLVPPNERFRAFARLLGLDNLDDLQRAIVRLCTKPEATVADEAKKALDDLESIESRLAAIPELQKANRDLRKGAGGTDSAFSKFETRTNTLVGKKIPAAERHAHLVRMRDEQAAKIYSGSVALRPLGEYAHEQHITDQENLTAAISSSFLADWANLATRGMAERLQREAELLRVGAHLLADNPESCPLCGQPLTSAIRQQITERHAKAELAGHGFSTQDARSRVERVLSGLRSTAARHRQALESRGSDLLLSTGPKNREKVKKLFGGPNEAAWETVCSASDLVAPLQDALNSSARSLEEAISTCEAAAKSKTETTSQAETLGLALNSYLEAARALTSKLVEIELTLFEPARILRQAVDELAGTAELTLLIELFEKKSAVTRALKIRDVLEGLKDLKKTVEQTMGETMDAAINAEMTNSVMAWYARIRTEGDPDVHFSGFAMDRTKAGDFKKGRVNINAQSYGVELASAVSSLSESKLNALGQGLARKSGHQFRQL